MGLLDTATKYLDYHNSNDGKNVPSPKETFGTAGAWCYDFVRYCAYKNGVFVPPGSSSLAAYEALKGRATKDPKPGDLVFFTRSGGGHAGIVESNSGGKIKTIEGNSWTTSAKPAYSYVCRHERPLSGKTGSLTVKGYISMGEAQDIPSSDDNAVQQEELVYATKSGQPTENKPVGKFMAYWGELKWQLSWDSMRPISDFTTGYRVKQKSQNNTGGTTSITTTTIEAQRISFSYTPLTNVFDEVGKLRHYIGKVDYFYLGTGRVGRNLFRLSEVDYNAANPLPDGTLTPSPIKLTFTEIVDDAVTKGGQEILAESRKSDGQEPEQRHPEEEAAGKASNEPRMERIVKKYNPNLDKAKVTTIASSIINYGNANKIDPDLMAALIKVESTFRPNIVNDKTKCKGLCQLADATAKEMGVSDPFSPQENIKGGAGYLRKMVNRTGGSKGYPSDSEYRKALQAYNAGYQKYKDSNGTISRKYADDVLATYREIKKIN